MGVDPRRRLVEQQQPGPAHEAAPDLDAALGGEVEGAGHDAEDGFEAEQPGHGPGGQPGSLLVGVVAPAAEGGREQPAPDELVGT